MNIHPGLRSNQSSYSAHMQTTTERKKKRKLLQQRSIWFDRIWKFHIFLRFLKWFSVSFTEYFVLQYNQIAFLSTRTIYSNEIVMCCSPFCSITYLHLKTVLPICTFHRNWHWPIRVRTVLYVTILYRIIPYYTVLYCTSARIDIEVWEFIKWSCMLSSSLLPQNISPP